MIEIEKTTVDSSPGYLINYCTFKRMFITQELINDLDAYNSLDLEAELFKLFRINGASTNDAAELIQHLKQLKTR